MTGGNVHHSSGANPDCEKSATLLLLDDDEGGDVSVRLPGLCEFLGVDVVETLRGRSLNQIAEDNAASRHRTSLACDSKKLCEALARDGAGVANILSAFKSVLVYGFDDSPTARRALSELTGDQLECPVPCRERQLEISFANDLPYGCHQLRGLTLEIQAGEREWQTFRGESAGTLVRIGSSPYFVKLKRDSTDLFLLAGREIIDLDAPEAEADLSSGSYLQIAPWMMFLRAAFGAACWHNPRPHASWVIDDPLLKQRYGFLRYDDLIKAADVYDFAASIAFIPWNCRRTERRTVNLFRSRPDRLSICVHGCDHTDGEFKGGDIESLKTKGSLALDRMSELRSRVGLNHDKVMVFPQGGFCRAAMESLGTEGFLAAVNSSVLPSDSDREEVTPRNLLGAAVSHYGRCPLFSRRYPTKLFPIAFDLFMGKPAILVEHHGYFSAGYAPMTTFVRKLKEREPALVWSPVGQTLAETALHKRVAPGEEWVRFYTDHFTLRNINQSRTTYRLHRTGNFERVTHVMRDGQPVDAAVSDSGVTAEIVLNRGETARIEVPPAPVSESRTPPFSPTYRVRVAARRYLSEFRDNYVARNEHLLGLSRSLFSIATRARHDRQIPPLSK